MSRKSRKISREFLWVRYFIRANFCEFKLDVSLDIVEFVQKHYRRQKKITTCMHLPISCIEKKKIIFSAFTFECYHSKYIGFV